MTTEETAFNPTSRQLCPDGSCLGIIGADGRCDVCGRPGEGGAPRRAADGDPVSSSGDDAGSGAAAAGAEASDDDAVAETGFDAARRLCEDGACVGVVGKDGACNVCGRVTS